MFNILEYKKRFFFFLSSFSLEAAYVPTISWKRGETFLTGALVTSHFPKSFSFFRRVSKWRRESANSMRRVQPELICIKVASNSLHVLYSLPPSPDISQSHKQFKGLLATFSVCFSRSPCPTVRSKDVDGTLQARQESCRALYTVNLLADMFRIL